MSGSEPLKRFLNSHRFWSFAQSPMEELSFPLRRLLATEDAVIRNTTNEIRSGNKPFRKRQHARVCAKTLYPHIPPKYSMFVKLYKESGSVPSNRLLLKSSSMSQVRFPIVSGMEPVSRQLQAKHSASNKWER